MSDELPFLGGGPTKEEEVERFAFEKLPPIKGFPELRWAGKRPFTSTQFYPAQKKESYGEQVDGWMNKIFWGDNLQVMSHLLKHFRGKIKLVCIDPPFDSRADYKKSIQLKGRNASTDHSSFEEKQYTDIWTKDNYAQFMYDRLILLKELLSDDGCIYVHMNHDKVHHIRCIMDEVFGPENYRNDISWKRGPGKSHPAYFGRVKDTILFYSKGENYTWNKQFKEVSEEYRKTFTRKDERGYYVTQPLHSGKPGKEVPVWKGVKPPEGRGWAYKLATLDAFDAEGKVEWSEDGVPRLKRYLDEVEGTVVQDVWDDIIDIANPEVISAFLDFLHDPEKSDVWDDIAPVLSRSKLYTGYPTQKPEALLERMIRASSNPGDIVLDCFAGSGTALVAATKLGRRFIGADINLGSIETTVKRLSHHLMSSRHADRSLYKGEKYIGCGFETYNVNNYDVFRNPVEAKEILREALEIQPLDRSGVFDGAKDGYMVKIMPVNRIATRQDLNDLITGLDQKAYATRYEASPNKPVDKIMLVCMGHEPDLAATLKEQMKPYDLDVRVVDVLRDKSNLEFKRSAEARVMVRDGRLTVDAFYPMNLLQKLSLQQEQVDEWRQLVESIKIDWNYDGAVLEPSVIDVPDSDGLVAGSYEVPKDAGTIRIKITDLLSESLEMNVDGEA